MIGPVLIAFAAAPLGCYGVGSIPVGFLYARARGVDIRTAGSGNVGATNIGRVLGLRHFFLVFALDVLKGAAPSVAAGLLLPAIGLGEDAGAVYHLARVTAALSCILGHVFSCWLGFKGGKGVATSLGALAGVYPQFTWPVLIALGVWGLVAAVSRIVSLSSIVAAAAFAAAYAALYYWRQPAEQAPLLAMALLVPTLIVLTHRSNIRRLLAGAESRIERKKTKEGREFRVES